MRRSRREVTAPVKHSDPVVEQQLENIRQLQRQLTECEKTIASHRWVIADANEDDGRAAGEAVDDCISAKQLQAIHAGSDHRRERAAAGIDAEQQRMLMLHDRITALMTAVGAVDLAYL